MKLNSGFTYMSLLAAIAVLAIISGIFAAGYTGTMKVVEQQVCLNRMELMAMAETRFYAINERHTIEFETGEIVGPTSELIAGGFLLLNELCQGDYYWEGYDLHCSHHTENKVSIVDKPDYGSHYASEAGCIKWEESIYTTHGIYQLIGRTYYFSNTNDKVVFDNRGWTVHGGFGNDYLDVGNGKNDVFGEAGDDRLIGGNGKDALYGGTGCDYLSGNNGVDRLNGGPGNDYLDGGLGKDTAVFEWSEDEYSITYDGITTIVEHISGERDVLVGVEYFEWGER